MIKNFLQVYFGAFVNGLSLFFANVILARSLDESMYGIFSLSVMVLVTVSEMSDFGLNGGITRFVPYFLKNNLNDKLKQLLKTIWKWRLWMSVILTILGIILSPFLADYLFKAPELRNYLRLSFLGIFGTVMLGFVSTYLKAIEEFRYNTLLQSLKGALRILAVLILVLLGVKNIYLFLLVYILVPMILFLFAYNKLPKDFQKIEMIDSEKKKMHKKLANFSFWLTIWSLSAILASRVDQTMISNMLSVKEVAIYTTAFQFVFLYSILLQSFSAVLIPKLSGFKNKVEVLDYLKKITKYIFLGFLLFCGLICISQYIFPLVFGNKYLASVPVYLILSFSMAISFLGIPLSYISQLFNRTDLMAYSGFIQLVTNIVLNLYFIPKFGVMGAGYTFLFGVILSLAYNMIVAKYLFRCKEIKVV